MPLDHRRIAAAGWAYRTNGRGWIIYRNPDTGLWHTRVEALEIIGDAAQPFSPTDSEMDGSPEGAS